MEFWLKSIGAARAPLKDEWLRDKGGSRLAERVHFPKNARPRGISRGDYFLLYGVTDFGGRLIGAGRFDSEYFEDDGSGEPERDPQDVEDWPWRIDVNMLISVWHAHAAPALDAIGIPGTKVRRRSHIRISEDEYITGIEAIAGLAKP